MTTAWRNSSAAVDSDDVINQSGVAGASVTEALDALAGASAPAWGDITGTLSNQSDLQSALSLKAPLASPAFTGTPTAPTQPVADTSTRLATTAYVQAVADTLATKDTPAFVGIPTAPTAAPGTSTTQIATTAFVAAATKIVYFPVTFDGTTVANNNGYITVPAPGAGTVLSYAIAFYPQTNNDLTISVSQGGIAYSPAATITSAHSPGQVETAAPEGASFGAGSSIEFEIATANTVAGVCVAMVTYQLD